MNKLLRNDHGQLRNGWWILLFLVAFLASQWAYQPVSRGLQQLGIGKPWLAPLPVVFLLAVTWACLRLRRQGLSAVGLSMDAAWRRQLAWGVAIGAAEMVLVAALIFVAGGVRFELEPARGWAGLAWGLWAFACVAVLEELLFRGFVFQRLVDGIGSTAALLLMATLFSAAHWDNPGMARGTMVTAGLDNALGALVLGLAWLRTGSLALPIGIHFGWNWMQGAVLGFDVSGFDQTGWLRPHRLDVPQWLSGGAFGPEASVFAVLADTAMLLLLWRWKGTAEHRLPVSPGPIHPR